MKALSLTQPWASLVALGAKKVETRSWATPYRGPLAVHAAKGFPVGYRVLCRENPFYAALGVRTDPFSAAPTYVGYTDIELEHPETYLPRGAIVAVCDLVGCCRIMAPAYARATIEHHYPACTGKDLLDREMAFGDYTPGRYMWLLSDVVALPKPIPARASLGPWEVDLVDPRGGARGERTVEG